MLELFTFIVVTYWIILMPVRVVTDSGSDIPPQIAREMDITVIPLYMRFGSKVYRDWVDIDADGLYERLVSNEVHPTTSQPPVGAFVETYKRVAQETKDIVSIHLTSKLSGTFDSALAGAQQAMEAAGPGLRIEVVGFTIGINGNGPAGHPGRQDGQGWRGPGAHSRQGAASGIWNRILCPLGYLEICP